MTRLSSGSGRRIHPVPELLEYDLRGMPSSIDFLDASGGGPRRRSPWSPSAA
jgi:hypothetical protein